MTSDRRNLRRLREEQQRKQAQRRRLIGFGVVATIVLVGAVVAVFALKGGSSDGDSSKKSQSGGPKKSSPAQAESPEADPNLITTSSGLVLDKNADLVSHFQGDVPILMYHAIDPPPAGQPYPDLFVPPDEFIEEMETLDKQGFNGVTLRQVFDAWNDDKPLPENPIVISFDDGIRSQYTIARPELRKLRWPGVLNLKVDALTQAGELEPEAVKEMIDTGWEVDSHTIDHLDVTTLSGAELAHQIADSRTELQKKFNIPVAFFCYPAGAYDGESVAAVKAAGYEGATSVDPGLASKDEPFTLKRIRVDGGEGAGGLIEALKQAGVEMPSS
ncbi:hypothetical protein BH10ACT11_BH10ACT11_18270 [soil metagenome]